MRYRFLRPVLAAFALVATACLGNSSGITDLSSPTVVFTAPSDSIVSGTVNIAVSATDDTGVDNVVFYIDGKVLSEDPLPPYEAIWNTSKAVNGDHQISVTAFDLSGKTTTVAKVVTVINAPN